MRALPTLHFHPLASYCWKVLIALHENGTAFDANLVDLGDPAQRAALTALWPIGKFPVLSDGARVVAESSIIVEYLDRHHPGARPLVPVEPDAALEVRTWDRIFDAYVHTPMAEIVWERLRGAGADTSRAHATLTTAYAMTARHLASRRWVAGDAFTLADCSAAPALFYAATLQPFPADATPLHAYFERLVTRPSVARTTSHASPRCSSVRRRSKSSARPPRTETTRPGEGC